MLLNITEFIFRDEMSQHWQVRQLCGAVWQHSMLISSFIYLFMDCFLLHIYISIHTIYCICTALTLVLFRMWMFSVLLETSAVSVLVFGCFFFSRHRHFLKQAKLADFQAGEGKKSDYLRSLLFMLPVHGAKLILLWRCKWLKQLSQIYCWNRRLLFNEYIFVCFLTLTDPWFHCARAG